VVSAYYTKLYSKLFDIIDSTESLSECIINYVTGTQIFEVVDTNIKTSSTVRGCDFVNCNIEGIFENCFFAGCEINNSQLLKSKMQFSDANKSKVLNCRVESSQLTNCYFQDGYLNGDMFGGVFRSGKLGPNATMDSEVKVVTDTQNFFDTRFEEEEKGTDKGILKGYGKK
jgi:uncharacterized protein YjbI with pentapeptide repeats